MQIIFAQYFFYFLITPGIRHFHAYPFRFTLYRLGDDFDGNTRGFSGIPFFYTRDFNARKFAV
jgi:hypothetical protein